MTKMYPHTRFDLEQAIQGCWTIVDDLKIVNEFVLERDMTKDEISNTIVGLEFLYRMKFEKMWEIWEELLKEKQI